MISLRLAVVAEGVSIDQQTTSLSIYNVLEGIEGSGFPLFIQRITFVALYERALDDPEIHNGHVQVRLGDHELTNQAIAMNFQGKKRTRLVARFPGLLVPAPGDLVFRFTMAELPPAEYRVEVTNIQPAAEGAMPA